MSTALVRRASETVGRNRGKAVSIATVASFLGLSMPAYATGDGATYDVTPIVTSLTTELSDNIPVILGAVGALIALTVAIHYVRRFVK